MKISIIVPKYQEDENTYRKCMDSILVAMTHSPCDVEVYIATDIKGIGTARNRGASQTTSEILVFVDADCTVSPTFLKEVYEKAQVWENAGGGTKWVKFDKYSIGRILSIVPLAIWLYWHQVTFGAWWIRREFFDMLGGFDEKDDVNLDYDFALRLKKLAESKGCKFRSLKKCHITWSTRGYEKYGEWFWLKRYRLFKEN